jgi:hypothetical protein
MMAIGLSSAKPMKNKNINIAELVGLMQFPKNRFVQIRLLDKPWLAMAQHWIEIIGAKSEKQVKIPKTCLAFDNENDEFNKDCPYCELTGENKVPRKVYYVNAIIRDLEDNMPSTRSRPTVKEKNSGHIEGLDSKSWTPVKVIRLTPSIVQKIQDLSQLNVHKIKGVRTQVNVADDDYGMDINIKYDPDATGTDKYNVQVVGGSTPLTEQQRAYLTWDLQKEGLYSIENIQEASESIASMNIVKSAEVQKKGKTSSLDDLDMGRKTSSRTSRNKPSSEDEELDLYEEKPQRSRKQVEVNVDDEPVVKRRTRPTVNEDADDDEPTVRRRKPVATKAVVEEKPQRRTRPTVNEDVDDDEPTVRRRRPANQEPVRQARTEEKPVQKTNTRRKRPESEDGVPW